MRRDLKPGDRVVVTLGGVTHEFGPDQARISVEETTDRRGTTRYRYAVIRVALGEEFPEDVSTHLDRMRDG